MARSRKPGSEHVYALHDDWLNVQLPAGGSLLTPGASIWTDAHLVELTQHFVENPDAGSGDFLTKLNGQLRVVSPGAIQLMAELHVIAFLIISPNVISGSRKLSNIETVLSWMPKPPPVPDRIREAMALGLVHPGQWVMTRRDLQIAWLISFASMFRALPDSAAIARDPWCIRDLTLNIRDEQAEGARLALLHLSHPDTFEATVSPRHRQQIRDRFTDLTAHAEDIDRALLDIRAALVPVHGEHFNFYLDPVNRQWPRDAHWRKFMNWTGRFRTLPDFDTEERDYKFALAAEIARVRSAVLDGDAGWLELIDEVFHHKRNNLTAWRTHEPLLAWMRSDPSAALAALRALWTSEPPSTPAAWPRPLAERIDRFLARLPEATLPTQGARINAVAFLIMAEGAGQHPPLTARLLKRGLDLNHWGAAPEDATDGWRYVRWLLFLDEVVRDGSSAVPNVRDRLDAQSAIWRMVRCDEPPAGWSDELWKDFVAFRGEAVVVDDDGEEVVRRRGRRAERERDGDELENGEGDSAEPVDQARDLLQEASDALLLPRSTIDDLVDLLDDKGQIILYGPPGTGKTYVALHLAEAVAGDPQRTMLVQFHPSTSYEDFIEGLRPQVTPSGQVTYALMDGPLMLMVRAAVEEPDRTFVLVIDEINRANLPKVLGELLFLLEYRDRAARLLYRPEEPFRIPTNLRIIGTMNTADRSVALIDAAMRRRFNFVPFFPDHGPMQGILHRWLAQRGMRADVAPFLDAVNTDLRARLGPHHAIGPSHFMRLSLTDATLQRIWDANVFPLLEEFFWGDDQVDEWRWPAVRRRYRSILGPMPGDDDPDDELGGEPGDGGSSGARADGTSADPTTA